MIEREFFTTDELNAKKEGIFLADVESYSNYFLAAFKDYDTGKYAYFEAMDDEPIQTDWLYWFLTSYTTVGFNFKKYDLIILSMALAGYRAPMLKQATEDIIVNEMRLGDLRKKYKFEVPFINCVDLIEVAPLTGSLKLYGARLHCRHLQELPYHPSATLTREEIAHTRTYCFNDLDVTELLLRELSPHLELRASLSAEFGKDLRSLSDAQLAQLIIDTEIERVTGTKPKRPGFDHLVGTKFRYVAPRYIRFNSPALNAAVAEICASDIEIGPTGHVICPANIQSRTLSIAGKAYAIGMGGLHSNEKRQALVSEDCRIFDRDVTGYYPNLILKNSFAPSHLGQAFLDALGNMVDRRTAAKKAYEVTQSVEDKTTADGLKIGNNGTFGKTSDPYSTIYSPPMMVQTTLTGQLSLLMAIERLTDAAFVVVSANTDGIVTLCPHNRYDEFCAIFTQWEADTGLETEETEYKAIYSRDVNNYIAIKMDGKHKAKGVYSAVGSALNSPLSKNPVAQIAIDKAIAVIKGKAEAATMITDCQDIRRFISVRDVRGGGQKNGKYLGKVVRWYYAKGEVGPIVKCKNGHTVATTDGGKPLMVLPDRLPDDIDFAHYENLAIEILEDVGFQKRRNEQLSLIIS